MNLLGLPDDLRMKVDATLQEWERGAKTGRLWDRDASLWTGGDEDRWLGWLSIVEQQATKTDQLRRFAEQVRHAGFTHAVLLGMGGSSLCADVLARSFGRQGDSPRMWVLDSTDPGQVSACEKAVELSRTLFIVASKSGSTLEPNVLMQYFFERVAGVGGEAEAGRHFVAVTDPGSKLEQTAEKLGFLKVFLGEPEVGGRFSALSPFGMRPAAVMGLDPGRLLERAQAMVRDCGKQVPVLDNPGVQLGALLGVVIFTWLKEKGKHLRRD